MKICTLDVSNFKNHNINNKTTESRTSISLGDSQLPSWQRNCTDISYI